MSLNWVTGGSGGGGGGRPASSGGEVLKTGYIKKTKTMKKKFFVLRAECGDHPSCLEYYDSEKKWKANQPPKRVITLQSCFNINRRNDLKQRYVVALYTKDDCFGLALDSEEEAQQWLDALLETQRGDDSAEGERPKPAFEHVWQVQVQKKGLGSSRNILGAYMLCLTSHSLTLVRNGSSTQQATPAGGAAEMLSDSVEFLLNTIRRCGHSDCFFYMEVGRSSVTGAGELWMQTEDPNIAQNMHDSIFHAMMCCRNSASAQKAERGGDPDLAPHPRTRSSSANEATKPVSVLQRGASARYGAQSSNQSQQGFNVPSPGSVSAPQSAGWRPVSHHAIAQQPPHSSLRGTWVGGGGQQPLPPPSQRHTQHHQQQQYHLAAAALNSPSQRRHSVSGMGSRERCDSLPSSRARTISEGPPSSSLPSSHRPSPPSAAHSPSSCAPTHPPHASHHPHHHAPKHLVPGGMVRPHSMYSRAAGLSYSPPIVSSPVSPASGACSTTDSAGSSLSMEESEGWCASNGAAEESAYAPPYASRFGHSLTPDEPAIVEENPDDEYMTWVPGGTGLDMDEEEEGEYAVGGDDEGEGKGDEVDGPAMRRPKRWRARNVRRSSKQQAVVGRHPGDYVPMAAPGEASPLSHASSPPQPPLMYAATPGSLSLPLQSVSLIGRSRPLPKASSPPPATAGRSSQEAPYMEMHSPCGTSPLESADGYMAMSPVGSGGGPLVADGGTSMKAAVKQEDGYVPMTPGHPTDDGYVDMEPHQHKPHHDATDGSGVSRGEMSPAASSCSVTSGTPSTDTRFSEYHLEKVSSYFTPSEEEEDAGGRGGGGDDVLPMELRPVRAYSVGSKPETFRRKNWLEVGVVDSVRVRAFSVGSRQCQGLTSAAAGGGGPSSSPLHHSPHRHVALHATGVRGSPRGTGHSPKSGTQSSAKKGSKSSSAPILPALSNSWSGSSTLCSPPGSVASPYTSQVSQGSKPPAAAAALGADHDLMELDFSSGGRSRAEGGESPYVPMGVPPPAQQAFSPPVLLSPPGASPNSASSSSVGEPYVDMQCGKKASAEPLAYMEMFPVGRKASSAEAPPGDYVNMDGGRGKGEASRPIAIRKERREEGDKERGGSSPNFSLAGLLSRKSSSGTPPKGPFNTCDSPFGSLRRSRKKRGEEEEEEESSEGAPACDLPTPTAIFPFSLNSPGSPVRPFPPTHYESAAKCPVDATSGSVHISYPPFSSAPTTTCNSAGPKGQAKSSDANRRRSEFSLPPAGADRIAPQDSKPDYTNSSPGAGSEGDYMPMAPRPGRVRKESVVSAPANLSTPSSLFSSFSPSSKFTPQPSSDYVCMKAVRSPESAVRSCAPQRTKSSSADYMDIKIASEPPPTSCAAPVVASSTPGTGGSSKSDDYVEVDFSQKPSAAKPLRAVLSNVGAYVPSHTGFGFLPHVPSPSSHRPPSTPTTPTSASLSYTWPRKQGTSAQEQARKVATTTAVVANPKTDDYVPMDLGRKSLSPMDSAPPPATTASITATTTSLVTSPRPLTSFVTSLSSLPPSYKFALTSSSIGVKRLSASSKPSITTTSSSSEGPVLSSSLASPEASNGNPPPSITASPTTTVDSEATVTVSTTSASCVVPSAVPADNGPSSPPPSPLAVSGPIAIPSRTAPQHTLLPSAPPSNFAAECASSAALDRVTASSSERPKADENNLEQPQTAENKSSPIKVVTAKAAAAPLSSVHISSLARRVSSGKESRVVAGSNGKEGSPAAVSSTSGREVSKESEPSVEEATRQPPSRRGGRGCARRHSGDKESSEVRSMRPRRRSSDVSKGAAQQQEVTRAGGRGAEDKSGSYEKLLLAPGSRAQQRKWGAHKSLGERAPSLGWGPLRRQMSSPSAVPDPDGAYEKLLPSNGGPVSRRRSGDKPGGLLDTTQGASGYPPYSPVFSASSSSASSSSSLASVASSILLTPSVSAVKGPSNSATASPPPTTTTAANSTTLPGEIHYASLDLAPPTGAPVTASSNINNNNQNDNDNERGGRRSPRVQGHPSGAESPSGGEQPLNYAEIDFSKSMLTSVAGKNRVRH
ncbi:treacle protein isoform X2 [Ischnura elegans]|uniref:treacle protein isoform X2 n=1 Tax=Ischnura elegans TaxID=197161 RepID=UPI001ED87FD1|nr:treacle protein isoform X2 [Ischnura elegans]